MASRSRESYINNAAAAIKSILDYQLKALTLEEFPTRNQLPLMEPESVICLFDSLWFNHGFFKKHTNPSSPSSCDPNPDHITPENPPKKIPLNIIAIPVSVAVSKKQSRMRGSRREVAEKGTPQLKSVSELEFEELKGFMDLGFEFSEEDAMNSSLVEIIPGLHTLMKKSCVDKAENYPKLDNCKPRPYLSEAWEAMEKDRRRRRKMKKALAKWRIPAMSNEADMKHNLRWWAHTVASTLR